MADLDLDVSHPWEGKNPIRRPEWNRDCLPVEEEIIGVLEYFLNEEPNLIIPILTAVDMDQFFMEGKGYSAYFPRGSD